MKITTLLLMVLVLAGCENGELVLSDDARQAVKDGRERYSIARSAAFTHCMELAALNTRQGDDDVSDLISACGSQAHSLTVYLR